MTICDKYADTVNGAGGYSRPLRNIQR